MKAALTVGVILCIVIDVVGSSLPGYHRQLIATEKALNPRTEIIHGRQELGASLSRRIWDVLGSSIVGRGIYNPSVAPMRDGGGRVLVSARLSNWHFCPPLTSLPAVQDAVSQVIIASLRQGHIEDAAVLPLEGPLVQEVHERTVRLGASKSFVEFRGGEDARLHVFGTELWISYFSVNTTYLSRVILGSGVPLRRAKMDTHLLSFPEAKNINVIGVAGPGHLFVEVSVNPHIVIEVNTKTGAQKTAFHSQIPAEMKVPRLGDTVGLHGGFCCVATQFGHTSTLLGIARYRAPPGGSPPPSYMYYHIFYALRPTAPFDVVGISVPFCFALSGEFSRVWQVQQGETHPQRSCEAIQFVSGLAVDELDSRRLLVAMGVNDCEASLLALDFEQDVRLVPVASEILA